MNLGKIVGKGKSATVFKWGNCEVVKLFRADVSRDLIDKEAKVAANAYRAGIPTAAVTDTIEIDDRKGIVFEFLDGHNLDTYLFRWPWSIPRLIPEFARLHKSIHQCVEHDLPDQRARLKRMIYEAAGLMPDAKAEDRNFIDALPGGSVLCHNDFQPGNILVTRKGLRVVDWFQATKGNSLIDAASTVFKLRRAIGFDGPKRWRAAVAKTSGDFLATWYLKQYPGLANEDLHTIESLMPLLKRAYRRDYRFSLSETRLTLQRKLRDEGIDAAITWLELMESEGSVGSESLARIAFSSLRRHHPPEAIRYGERALSISGGDSALARELESTRSGIANHQRSSNH